MPYIKMRIGIFLRILVASVVPISCFAGNDIFSSGFDKIVTIRVPDQVKSLWEKENRQIDVSDIEKMPQDGEWIIEWRKYPDNCRFYVHDSKWGISAENLSVYSRGTFARTSRNYLLKIEAAMPTDTKIEASQISVGVFRRGMIEPGWTPRKELTLKRGENVSCDIPLYFANGSPGFQIMLKISGDVILRKLTLQELPDHLAEADITVLEGTLKDISAVPDPKKSDYPDCRFTALLEGDSIIDGAPCPQKMQLVIDGFKNYELMETSKLKTGDNVRCFVIPFEKLPGEKKTTQQADDLNLFDLPVYYVLEISKIPSFVGGSATPFIGKQEHVSVFERKINPPLSEDGKEKQRQAIEESLARINKMLEPYSDEAALEQLNKRFTKVWRAEKAKDRPGFNRLCVNRKTYVWRNMDNSFWVLPENHVLVSRHRIMDKNNLDALAALQEFLNANGVQLLIGIVPDLFAISARVINPEFRNVPDFSSAWVARELLAHNLEVVYASDKLLQEFSRYPFAFFYPNNGHPCDTTQDVLTDVFSDLLGKRYDFPETLSKKKFSVDEFPHTYGKTECHLFPANCDIGANRAGEAFLCRRVLYKGKTVSPDPQSPVLVMGNSFIQTPMSYPDSFPTLLASKMHIGIDYYRLNGSGPMTNGICQLFANPEKYLKGKRVMILIFGVAHFDDTHFNNIRDMDRQMSQLAGKAQTGTIPLHGNENHIPEHFKGLIRSECFTVPASVVDRSLPRDGRDKVLVIPVCADAQCRANLKVNGQVLEIPTCYGVYRWNRIVIPMPKDSERLEIELTGKSGTTIALGDIQIFQ